MGRAILSGRRERMDGEGERGSGGRYDARSQLLRRLRRAAVASGSARGRGRVVRFVLFPVSTHWSWVTLALLGAYHGANPAMGWLFAVGLGLQERSGRAVIEALPPIA